MTFKERLESGKFVVVVELQPPKGNDLSEIDELADLLRDRADAMSIPDLQHGIMRLGPLSVCVHLQGRAVESIFNLSCIHRNRLALQSELLNASALGLRNILLLESDPPSAGDHFEAKPVIDLDGMGLLEAAKRLQEGFDLMGNELKGKPQFFVGAPMRAPAKGQDLEREIAEMEKKVRLGVQFFVTPSIYDISLFEQVVRRAAPLKVPIIASVTLLKSVGMARYINQHVQGAFIPDAIIDRLMKASDKGKASIEIAGDLIAALQPLCQGIQIIPIGWERQLPALLDRVRL